MNIHAIIDNTVIKRGSQPDVEIVVYNDDGTTVDLTNAEVALIIKRWWTSTEVLLYDQCTITDAENGVCELYLLAEDTSSWELGRYVGEVLVSFPNDTSLYKSEDIVFWVKPSLGDV
jgi:hypothetical protein